MPRRKPLDEAGRRRLRELLDGASVHVFDVDHTLTHHSTGRRFAQTGVRHGIFRLRHLATLPWFYLRYRLGTLQLSDITREIRAITGMTRDELRGLAEATWREYGERDLYPTAAAHIAACRERGHRVILLSTSFDVILQPLAATLQVDTVISSELEFIDDRATGWLVGGPCYAEEKTRRLERYLSANGIPADACAFYSDSFHDMPSFAHVGFPVPVHPDTVLRAQAQRAAWPVITW